MGKTKNMEEKELIVLQGLEGNQPTQLYGLQVYLEPHLDSMIFAWWMVMLATVVYLLGTYMVIPLWHQFKSK